MDALTSDDILFEHDRRLNGALSLAGLVVLVYDYLLTLDMEVKYMWSPGNKGGSAWFLFIRYFAIGANVAMPFMNFGDFPVERLKIALQLLVVIQELTVGCTLIRRVYAMYGFSKRILCLLVAAALIAVGLAVWSVAAAGPTPVLMVQLPGCQTLHSHTQSIRMAAAWVAELACETLVLGLTLFRAWDQTRSGIPLTSSLWTIMIRDGAMYFTIICLANLANILMFYFGDINTAGSVSWFTVMISVVMISRLMLHLRAVATDEDESPHSTRLGTLPFAMGEPEESVL
ncbi:hypothetical protein FB451DRAFT_1396198 [Mycena latifolia]|nr:hypothetical protein FB451DRAFT_1396198 [Mycena latifolia]